MPLSSLLNVIYLAIDGAHGLAIGGHCKDLVCFRRAKEHIALAVSSDAGQLVHQVSGRAVYAGCKQYTALLLRRCRVTHLPDDTVAHVGKEDATVVSGAGVLNDVHF